MKCTGNYGNVCTHEVERLDIISKFFEASNTINKHNQQWQSDLELEKHWLTQHDPWFHLYTALIGINVEDCYMLADYHKIINYYLPDKKSCQLKCSQGTSLIS